MKTHHSTSDLTSTAATTSTCSTSAPTSSPFHDARQHQSRPSTSSTTTSNSIEEHLITFRYGGGCGTGQDTVVVERRGKHSAVCRWTVNGFSRVKARVLWSRYFEVGGYDCRLLIYPKGDAQALPGYSSVYLQVMDPRGPSSSSGNSNRWDCFTSYRLSIVNHLDEAKSVHRDSWHRFSSKKKSHGWCDFTPSASVFDPKWGFLMPHYDSILVMADILVLDETVSFTRGDAGESQAPGVIPTTDVLSGKFTWKVRNFSLFRDMIKTQKIISPVFPAGECNLRISVYQSSVGGVEHLSMCLESKDTEKAVDCSCWCLFRMSVLGQHPAGVSVNHIHRDSYGRFAGDNKKGDDTSLGWNDCMRMSNFISPDSGYLVDNTAVFSMSFHVIKESSVFTKNVGAMVGGRGSTGNSGQRKSDAYFGKFTWRIENFTKLKDLLKKRKITGLCIKGRRFQIGNRDCRLIVYPRGQSQPPCHLSVFLEVMDSRNSLNDWSCFVSHRLSVVNQKMEEKSVAKESQNRYSKYAKDWGWREFITLTSLFDQDSGFLVQDTVVFSAEVLILKETSIMKESTDLLPEQCNAGLGTQIEATLKRESFTWRVENFLSFKEIMETRKIFSKFFQAGGCELRIGVYESFDTICIYLESDQSSGSDPENNFWVKYRMTVINQKNPARTVWKESSICTKTWNNSVLQFMKVSDMLEVDAGFLVSDTVIFVCKIIDSCPWFEFSDLEVLASEDDQDSLSTDPDELVDSEDSEGISRDEEDMFQNLLSRAGFHLSYGDNPSHPQVTLREKLLMDAGAIAGFLSGLRIYLDDPAKVKRLLLPTKLSGGSLGKKNDIKCDTSSPSLMNLLMGVKVLQQAIIDLLLDIMVECCQPSDLPVYHDVSDFPAKCYIYANGAASPLDARKDRVKSEDVQPSLEQRLDSNVDENSSSYAVQSTDLDTEDMDAKTNTMPETFASDLFLGGGLAQNTKNKWPEQSEELLGLIVNSLRALEGAVPQDCSKPRIRPQSVQKMALLLDKAPRHLKPDLVSLVPKLVDHSEYSLAACALLDHLEKPDAEPALRLPVFAVLSQLEISIEVRERMLVQVFGLLEDSNDEQLVQVITFIFKTASLCHHLPQAARAVRTRLKKLDLDIPQCVMDILSKTLLTFPAVAEAILRDIDCDCDIDENCTSMPCGLFSNGSNGISLGEELAMQGCDHMSDVYILLEMLSLPGILVDVLQVFEKCISRGSISLQLLAMILDRRHAQRLAPTSTATDILAKSQCIGENCDLLLAKEDDFNSVLALGEVLSLSLDPRVQNFVRMLYAIMFKIYSGEHYRVRMLKGLVDRVTSSSDNCGMVDIDIDVLTFFVREEDGVARPVLNMMREICEIAHVDRAALWHQLCATEDDNVRAQEEMKELTSNYSRENAALSRKFNESEMTVNHIKSELRSEADCFAREKKELSEQILEVENQLDWVRSERDEEISRLSADKKVLQDHLHDSETQLLQLRSCKRDELKRVMKDKNTLAERLKNAEAARKRLDEELKRLVGESVTREEVLQSLEDKGRRLKEAVDQTTGEKREKEEHVARCEAYINELEGRLQTCEEIIRSLDNSLQDEISRHAPLYGAGLEALSMQELETISRIHEEGLMQIRSIQQIRANNNDSLANGVSLPQSHGLYTTTHLVTCGLPSSTIQNSGTSHNDGNVINTTGSWFSPT